MLYRILWNGIGYSGIARAFTGERVAHLEGQNEEEKENKMRKIRKCN